MTTGQPTREGVCIVEWGTELYQIQRCSKREACVGR